MKRNFYSPFICEELYSSRTRELETKMFSTVLWNPESSFNQNYWPERIIIGSSKQRSVYVSGLRKTTIFDYKNKNKKILIPGEQAIWYIREGIEPLLFTFGDARNTDVLRNKNSVNELVNSLDDHFIKGNNMVNISGLLTQQEAWDRTINSLKKGFEKLLQSNIYLAAQRTAQSSYDEPTKTQIEQIVVEYQKRSLENFFDWGNNKGFDLELLKEHFTNLAIISEEKLFHRLNLNPEDINLKFT